VRVRESRRQHWNVHPRGLGYEVSKLLASTESLAPYILYVTSRTGQTTDLQARFPDCEVRFAKLDVSKSDQVDALARKIKEEGHGIQAFVCNGALADDTKGFTAAIAHEMFDVNYRGCLYVRLSVDDAVCD
jgi:NAD(P)-dependent dehydrogenase (short-subunit alcohol dehydrogenase family)